MKKLLCSISIFIFIHFAALAQSLEPSLISTFGTLVTLNTYQISQSIGEVIIGSGSADSLLFTQGFHQPYLVSGIDFSYQVSVKDATCPDTKDGMILISNIEGCDNVSIEWSNGQFGNSINELEAGLYVAQLSGCGKIQKDSIMVGLVYEESCLLNFYTAFSPNGDGVNDTWEIDNIEADINRNNEVKIFNRWGNLVIEINDYDNIDRVWDGKNMNGKDMTEGTYYFSARIGGNEFTGYIELTR